MSLATTIDEPLDSGTTVDESPIEFFLAQYRHKCDHFGDEPHPAVQRQLERAIRDR